MATNEQNPVNEPRYVKTRTRPFLPCVLRLRAREHARSSLTSLLAVSHGLCSAVYSK